MSRVKCWKQECPWARAGAGQIGVDERGEGIERADEPGIIINLLVDGTIVVDDNSIDLDGLRRIIEEEIQTKYGGDGSRAKLLLRADHRLAAARVNEIVRLLQDLGVDLGRFATEIQR